MSFSLLKTLARQLVMIFSIILILFAAYLSIGRQFMPVIANYKEQVEQRLTDTLGVPVSIESLTGYFDSFNPAIEIEGLRFSVLEADTEADFAGQGLEFERATIVLNMAETIRQRQVVLDNFIIQGLDVTASRTESGSWELSGISLQGQGEGTLDLDVAYDTVQRVARMELTDLSVELRLNDGNSARFNDIGAIIQNAAGNHYIHVNAVMDDNDEEILLSLELAGGSLAEVSGTVHASLPLNDYSSLTEGEQFADVRLGEVVGGGQAWLAVEQGQVESLVVQPRIEHLDFTIESGDPLVFQDLSGSVLLSLLPGAQGSQGWELAANDLNFTWNDRLWRDSDSYVEYRPDEVVRIRAEALDIDIMRGIIVSSGLAGEQLNEQLGEFRPRGIVRNLTAVVPLQQQSAEPVLLRTNLDNIAIDTVQKIPGLGGVTGYLEVEYDQGQQLIKGMGEVSSENFSIHLARVFADSWSYDYVNGRLKFLVDNNDGLKWKMSSSMIAAESEIVDGRAQFSLNFERDVDGNRGKRSQSAGRRASGRWRQGIALSAECPQHQSRSLPNHGMARCGIAGRCCLSERCDLSGIDPAEYVG